MTVDLIALKEQGSAARPARSRRSLDQETQSVLRVLPIRWRLLLIAALNVVVASILALLIWNGANVLSRAWDDVRTVRESDRLLVLLESEASRLQNLIHRYINQPSQEVLSPPMLFTCRWHRAPPTRRAKISPPSSKRSR